MKKFFKIFGLVVLALAVLQLLLIMLFGLLQSRWDTIRTDNFRLGVNTWSKTCFVSTYWWPAKTDYVEVDIPDSVEGYRVTTLGGYGGSTAGSPFMVELPYKQVITVHHGAGTLPEDAQIEQYHMVVNIGENLRKIDLTSMDVYYETKDNQFIQILVTVNCDEDNRTFYSKDGKLYRRSDNSLVEGFFYYSDYCD